MTSKRQANFELLRVVAMLMIVTLHYLVKGAVAVPYGEDKGLVNLFAWLLEAFCIVAVNCYVLLSGYFLVESVWKPGRIVSLLVQILFYSVLIPVAMIGMGMIPMEQVGVYDWIGFLLPIETEHYWFATAYFFLYLFAPVLAAGVKKMEQKTLQKAILLLVLFFSVGKTIFPISLVTDRYGYDFGWFLCLFLIAAYLRLYGCQWLEKRRNCILLYGSMSVCIFLLWLFSSVLAEKIPVFGYYADMPYTYNHLFCLLGAIGLFMLFKHIKIKEGVAAEVIRRIAPYSFGVYLVHEHILVRYEWTKWLNIDTVSGTWAFVPHMLASAAAVYAVGSVIDFVRAYLFRYAGQIRTRRKEDKWDR